MTDITLDQQPPRRFDLPRAQAILFRPRRGFREMASESRATWLTPMLLLSITAILVVIVAGYLRSRAAMMGEIPLPPDWEFWTPEMQNNYMQAQDRKSTRLNSSHSQISYAVFCLKKKKK